MMNLTIAANNYYLIITDLAIIPKTNQIWGPLTSCSIRAYSTGFGI